jgi:hypothetical protein
MYKFILLSLGLIISISLSSQDTVKVNIHNADQFIGMETTICDVVTDTYYAEGKNTYLNFGGKYPDHKFSMVIFPRDQENFPFNPGKELKGKKICVTGRISEFRNKAQMIINQATQINIQE